MSKLTKEQSEQILIGDNVKKEVEGYVDFDYPFYYDQEYQSGYSVTLDGEFTQEDLEKIVEGFRKIKEIGS